ncbi:hypothetical protein FQK02_21195 [Xanthomonas vasicola]|uniref:hypothetical protein n=1 Tax=Xanthomonas vasicola TaxID=56459 RepID=UPI0001CBEFA9|nr:hypothetical protein [Xanthomonas vasicola]KFA32159.1 hypothetical protein KW5_0100755 [Xanthomonas vasicola pv. vasculorum NCPPB 1326]MBV6747409.1 hypothetical protein [Xanthomonas vasicola pv. vasculorum NCPPB 890]MDO6948716.1 hypothetical protein [Xanthomonas vasicola]MDO6960751.1 hypothetical protein [Xanthomonas vasicola]MDO6969446.1 hypothetical protein [Xanthomonas vasicola]
MLGIVLAAPHSLRAIGIQIMQNQMRMLHADAHCWSYLQPTARKFGDAYHATQPSLRSPIAAIITNDFSRFCLLAMIQAPPNELTPCALDTSWC